MQALNAGCLGHPFALSRCYASGEKRPRRRKTKEERRSMVDLFLTEYRSKHNGDFPSLNMTHKEVGGSFYTVREIVRDIIQENKVLAPGNASLKSLSLEDCSENHANDNTDILNKTLESQFSISSITCPPLDEQIEFSSESESEVAIPSTAEPIYNGQIRFSFELDSDSLISSNNHQLQNKQTESCPQLKKHDEEERVESLTSDQESSHPPFSLSEYLRPKTYSYLQQSSDSADQFFTAELKEDISSAKSGQAQNIGTHKQIITEHHDGPEICSMDRVEQKSLFSQSISSASPLNSTVLDDEETRSNNTISSATDDNTEVQANFLTYKADMLPEKSLSYDASDRLLDGSVAFDEEDSSLEFCSTKTFISDLHDLNTDELNGSDISSGITSLAAEVALPIPATDKTEVEEGAITLPILVDNESDNPEPPLYESSEILSSGVAEVEATETGDSPGELLLPNLKKKATGVPKAECTLSDNNCDGASLMIRKLPENSNKETKTENNVLWRAIKSFVDSIFKFWTQ